MIKMHSIRRGWYFLYFLEIHDKLAGKMSLKTTLYHILAVCENFCTDERRKHNPSKFWVMPDKIVAFLLSL